MKYLYNIAGLQLLFDIPYPIHIGRESQPFLSNYFPKMPYDWCFEIRETTKLLEIPKDAHRQICFWYHSSGEEHTVWFCSTANAQPYAMAQWKEKEHYTLCSFRTGCESYINYSRNLCEMMSLENLLLYFHGFILHSSLVRYQGNAILFSASSGVGKSTQADLWKKYKQAEVLNGDRAGICQTKGVWMAYGLPFAGSSGIYCNESAKIKAIVLLKQAKENRIRKLNKMEAMHGLYPEISMHNWNQRFVEKMIDVILHLLQDIPVYQLECLPEESAVNLLHDTLF